MHEISANAVNIFFNIKRLILKFKFPVTKINEIMKNVKIMCDYGRK